MEKTANVIYFSYDGQGYYKGPTYDQHMNSTLIGPAILDGFWPRWGGCAWVQVENHVGESGWCNEQPHTIAKYGPYPVGWSDTPPPPTTEELFARLRGQRDAHINSVLWMRERHSDEQELGTEPTLTPERHTALLTYIQALRDIPTQPGSPWDGGGELTPWPTKPEI